MAISSGTRELCKHGIIAKMCSECADERAFQAAQAHPKPAPSTKPKNIQVLLKTGAAVTVPIADPEMFNFGMYIALVRGGGGVMSDTVFVPYDNILLIGLGELQIVAPDAMPKKNLN